MNYSYDKVSGVLLEISDNGDIKKRRKLTSKCTITDNMISSLVCERISDGETLKDVCTGVFPYPNTSQYRAILRNNTDFQADYKQARLEGMETERDRQIKLMTSTTDEAVISKASAAIERVQKMINNLKEETHSGIKLVVHSIIDKDGPFNV